MGIRGQVDLSALAERIRDIEDRHEAAHRFVDEPADDRTPTGWTAIDAALGGGLSIGGLHEWFGVADAAQTDDARPARASAGRWTPPLCILAHLARQAFDHHGQGGWTVWVGRSCHPYPRVLIRGGDRRLLDRSLFVAPRDAAARLWAMDLALRSPAVGCVIADGSGFDRAATQRIQHVARAESKWALTARPPPQRDVLSAAQTRWRVRAAPPVESEERGGGTPCWAVQLMRCKGLRSESHDWLLEWDRVESAVHLSARLADYAGPTQAAERPAQSARPRRRA